MNKENTNPVYVNANQFLVLFFLSLIILGNNVPVLLDQFHNRYNYRLHDGWGDAMIDFLYFIITCIVLMTMRFKKNRADFVVVFLFGLGLFICISAVLIYAYIAKTILSSALMIYLLFSFMIKNINSEQLDDDINKGN